MQPHCFHHHCEVRMQSADDIQLLSPSPSQPCEESANSSEALYTPETDKNGETIRKEYVCYKQGESKCSEATERQRDITREKCGARLTVVKNWLGEGFVVTQFMEGHTHPPTMPRKKHFLRSHCRVLVAQKALTQQLAAANVLTSQEMSVIELQAGGLEYVGCFTYTIEEDDEHRLTHCFWADATSRKSYQHFGDVVVFDTTYNTNKYCLMFAPLLGVNHHGQTTLFGCAFLSDEKRESFEWLFKEFLKAMPGPPPKMIITDQDPAMTKAIACALPNMFHRYCIRHIVSKFFEKIGALACKEHYEKFKKCIWNSESPEEFDATWAYIVGKSNLSSHQWLQSMYEIRDRWVLAYMRHIFSTHMTSSQRAEISHSFFKRYMSNNNSMYEFVTRFDRALARLRYNELDLDHKDINEKLVLKTSWLMEKKMNELYTLHSFKKFQEEIFQIGAYVLMIRHEDERLCVWKVQREEMEGSRGHEVSVDKSSNHFTSCTIIDDAVLDEEGTEVVREALLSSQKKIGFVRGSRQDGSTSSIQLPISLGSQHGLKEPFKVRAKGCGKRLKGGKEKAVKKSRKCHGCGSSQDVRLYDDDDFDDEFAFSVLPITYLVAAAVILIPIMAAGVMLLATWCNLGYSLFIKHKMEWKQVDSLSV
ncbi:hypothetical protein RHSIM_Rhsim01G0152900 [Rhododendron simsii]|uniref:Protein FAR1-RELATED SEQUENCE n=1 Tax=Rhododendron simsii TaxID=118357 RepID=A0A834LXY1_RHOSS|nr:hypothetical protein RHSIM_Rhsim01G0152900 [Rhododendron simsii]